MIIAVRRTAIIMNVLFSSRERGDGAVHFFKKSIDPISWAALGTRAGAR
jgi:hypothetical protein